MVQPINLEGIFDPRVCRHWREGEAAEQWTSRDLCLEPTRKGCECTLKDCPLLSTEAIEEQLHRRQLLMSLSPPSHAKVLATGEETESHPPDRVWAWHEQERKWINRVGSDDELAQTTGMMFLKPSSEQLVRWVLNHHMIHEPDKLGQLVALANLRSVAVFIPDELLRGITELDQRVISLLKSDPGALDSLDPFLLEELIAEIMASWGWKVQLVANQGNTGADILALTKPLADGAPVLFFVEVKRWRRRVGIEVIDRVLGAMSRQQPEPHVGMIVSLSGFKRFRDGRYWTIAEREYKRIRLRGREDIIDWLRAYSFRESGGLWLPANVRRS